MPSPGTTMSSARYWSPKAWRPITIGLVQPGTSRGMFEITIGSRKMTPPRMLRIVPFGERYISFRPNSFDPRLVGRDRRALDADPVLLDRVRGVDRDLVGGRVAALDPEVEVHELDVEVGQDQLLLDEGPDDPGHLVAVELDDRVLDFDLRHAWPCTADPDESRRHGDGRTAPRPRAQPTRSSTSRARSRTTTSSRPTGRWSRALRREGAGWAEERCRELGARLPARAQVIRWGFEANEKEPRLRTHDRFGNRIDEVEFDPSWHELMRIGVGHGPARAALARARARRPRRPRRDVHAASPRPRRASAARSR